MERTPSHDARQDFTLYDNFLLQRGLPEPHRFQYFLDLIPEKGRILDAGCGIGRWAAAMHKARSDVTIDLLDKRMSELKPNLQFQGQGELIEKDILDFEARQDRYDGIWARASLIYIPNEHLTQVFKIFHKSLKNKGIISITHAEPSETCSALGLHAIPLEKMCHILEDCGFEIYKTSRAITNIEHNYNNHKLPTYIIHAGKSY